MGVPFIQRTHAGDKENLSMHALTNNLTNITTEI
jgi:hypothetical protein